MKKGIRIALATAAVAAGLALAAPPATAQLAFSGSFPLPHGRISVGFGDPFFPVGAYVPSQYRVIRHARYGNGFFYRSRWIPVRSYRSRWVVCERPVVYSAYDAYDDDDCDDGLAYQPYVSYRPRVYSPYYGQVGWSHGWDTGQYCAGDDWRH